MIKIGQHWKDEHNSEFKIIGLRNNQCEVQYIIDGHISHYWLKTLKEDCTPLIINKPKDKIDIKIPPNNSILDGIL